MVAFGKGRGKGRRTYVRNIDFIAREFDKCLGEGRTISDEDVLSGTRWLVQHGLLKSISVDKNRVTELLKTTPFFPVEVEGVVNSAVSRQISLGNGSKVENLKDADCKERARILMDMYQSDDEDSEDEDDSDCDDSVKEKKHQRWKI